MKVRTMSLLSLIFCISIASAPAQVEMGTASGTAVGAGVEMAADFRGAANIHEVYTVENRRCSDGIWENSNDPEIQAQITEARRGKVEGRDYDCWTEWSWTGSNLTTTQGLNDLLDKYFKGSGYTATWYCGLVDNAGFSAYDAADTAAQINGTNGWDEGVPYSNATRPTITLGTVSGGSVDNSASKCVFNINATLTVRGAFVISDDTKSGTAGFLYGEADFAAARAVLSGDTLNVTTTLTASWLIFPDFGPKFGPEFLRVAPMERAPYWTEQLAA